jgi:hypothetical protein
MKAQLVIPDRRALLVPLVQQVHRVRKAFRASKVCKASRVSKGRRVSLVPLVPWAILVLPDRLAPKGRKVFKASKETRD